MKPVSLSVFRHALLATLLFSTPLLVSAGDEDADVPSVVVTATRSSQDRILTPVSVQVITRDDIAAAGARNVSDLLRNTGAVQVKDLYGDGSRTSVSIRGFGATAGSNTLILLDGRRLNNSDLADPDLASIALNDIERIEIMQGSAGSLFGDQATGGVVNIITVTPTESQAQVTASLGDLGDTELQGNFSYQGDSGFGATLNASTQDSDGYRDRSKLDRTHVYVKLDYSYEAGKVFVEGQDTRENLQLAGALTREEMKSDRKQAQYNTDFIDTDTRVVRLGIEHTLLDNWQLLIEATQRESDANGILSGFTPFTQDRRVLGLNPRIVGQLNNVMITAGLDIENTDYDLSADFGGFIATTASEQKVLSEFLQVIAPIADDLSATVGVRHASVENDITDTFSFPAGTEFDDSHTVFELGLRYDLNGQTTLILRRDENYRFPKVDELTFMGINIVELETQLGVSWEFGLAWQDAAWQVNALVYQLDLEDELGFDPLEDVGFGFFGANANLDDTRRRGASITVDWLYASNLKFTGRADYVDARFIEGAFKNNDVPYVSGNNYSISATFTPIEKVSIYMDAQYYGSRYAEGDFSNTLGQESGYTLVNANVAYSTEHWGVSLRIENLTDRQYSEYVTVRFDGVKTYYPSPERRFVARASYRF